MNFLEIGSDNITAPGFTTILTSYLTTIIYRHNMRNYFYYLLIHDLLHLSKESQSLLLVLHQRIALTISPQIDA